MQDLVIIENSMIMAMMADAEIVSQVPCLQNINTASTKKAGCGKCGRKNTAKALEYTSIKNCIAGMSSNNKRTLKKILDAHKVRIVYLNDTGRIIKLTF
jgi:hypothetical protein